MQWCLNYKNYLKTKQKNFSEKINEVTISNINNIEELNNILNILAADGKRIIVDYNDFIGENIDFLESYYQKYSSIAIRYDKPEYAEKTHFIPYFFDIIVDNTEFYNDLKEKDITDIYIGDNLGFNMKLFEERKKTIRVFPYIGQNSGIVHKFSDFFIRPEDISIYEKYIDVCDFSHNSVGDILADIYINQKKWIGDLSEIIANLPSGYRGDGIIPDFGTHRLFCKKRCQDGKGCNICERYAELSQKAKNIGIYFKA